jgi:NTP pyrophosphatase (non-canonical NTP hydrolase)
MSTLQKIDLNRYSDFVKEVTSDESNRLDVMVVRLGDLFTESNRQNLEVNPSLLVTASIGLSSEVGEFNEIIKKMIFQGKPLNEDNVFHMKRELGDVMWYWINACRALNLNPNEVIEENVRKLEARYPGGKFDAYYSENRKDGDL